MKVGIDYLPAVTRFGGVGRYARELVRALVRLGSRPELALYDAGGEARTIGEPWLGLAGHERAVTRVSRRIPRRAANALARYFGRGADRALGGVDLFQRMLPHYPLVSAAPEVMAIAELPEAGSPAEAELAEVARGLAGVLVPSRHGAAEVERRLGVDAARIHEVSLGCEHWRRGFEGAPPPKSGAPSVLVLGALKKERRPELVLAAFEELFVAGDVARLVVLGGGAGADRERFGSRLGFSPAREAVEWIRDPDERELPRRVAEAWVLVHLSVGELSAVTPLEAFSFGTAVVTNPGGAFAEALGSAALTFDTVWRKRPDVHALARVLRAALESATDAAAFERRIAIAAPFTWEQSAQKTVDAWRRVVGSRA